MNRLKENYLKEETPSLMEKFNNSSVMQTPKVEKNVIKIRVGDAVSNANILHIAVAVLTQITGQKKMISKAIKYIAGLRLR